jgi:M6 family metalloprotease-like protein
MCIICVSTISIASLIAPAHAPDQVPTQPLTQVSAQTAVLSSKQGVQDFKSINIACNKSNLNKVKNNTICLKQGKVYKWTKTKNTPARKPTTSRSMIYQEPTKASDNIEICKIKEASKSRGFTGAGFPAWKTLTPSTGTVKWALIPIDFSDLPGEKNFRSRIDNQMKLLSEWYSVVSEGKLKVEWVVADNWVRLPAVTKEYVIPLSVNLNDAVNGPKFFREAMDAADPVFDFTNIQTVNFILPKGQKFIGEGTQGFPWDQAVKDYVSKEGSIASYSIPGQFFDLPGKTYWSYWAHEFGHAIGIPHVGASRGDTPPFNPLDLMGGQDGPSRELSGWLRFFATWLPDEKVYCKETSNLTNVELTLVPLSGNESGIKLAIFPVSPTKAVIIESRRVTKFSCTTPTLRNGVLVYIYDATLGHGENFLIPISPSNRKLEDDSCGELNDRSGLTKDELLHEGDKVTAEGITVELITHGNYDKILVSKKS